MRSMDTIKTNGNKEKDDNEKRDQTTLLDNLTFNRFLSKETHQKYSFEDIVRILLKQSEYRIREDVLKLKTYFEGLNFFQSIKKENHNDDEVIYQVCKELKYRKYNTNDKICEYGTEGEEFYIIMKGSVSVLVPQQTEANLNQYEALDYVQENKEYIIWDRQNKCLLDLMKEVIKQGFSRGKNKPTLILDHHKKKYEFKMLKKVTNLSEGICFGELALMQKHQKRTATIICNEEVHVAWLNQIDFDNVIKLVMQRRIDDKVDFLANFRLTKGINRQNLVRLTYFLKE